MNLRELDFLVPGRPIPKARARVVAGGAFTPKSTRQYERSIGQAALFGLMARQSVASWPLDARYRVSIVATFPTRHRCDIDNVAKAVLDGCNGVLWDDDSQVDALSIERAYDPTRPGVSVRVEVAA